MKSLYKFCENERERDKCFVSLISLQQRKHLIAIKAFLDLASGGSTWWGLCFKIQFIGMSKIIKLFNYMRLFINELMGHYLSPWDA